jgi:hypothetical protein
MGSEDGGMLVALKAKLKQLNSAAAAREDGEGLPRTAATQTEQQQRWNSSRAGSSAGYSEQMLLLL